MMTESRQRRRKKKKKKKKEKKEKKKYRSMKTTKRAWIKVQGRRISLQVEIGLFWRHMIPLDVSY